MRRFFRSLRDQYAAAPPRVRLLLLVCLALVTISLGNMAVTSLRAYTARLDETVDMRTLEFQRLSRNITGGDAYVAQHAEIARLRDELISTRLVKAGTLSLSEAMFQHIVNDWAERSMVSILSIRVLPLVEEDDFSRMRLAINGRAEIGAIQQFMGLVRQSPRMVFFEEVEIRAISPQERRYYYFNAQLTAWTVTGAPSR